MYFKCINFFQIILHTDGPTMYKTVQCCAKLLLYTPSQDSKLSHYQLTPGRFVINIFLLYCTVNSLLNHFNFAIMGDKMAVLAN